MPYYKVVENIEGRLVSLYGQGKWQVEYIENEWSTAPKGTYLWVYYAHEKGIGFPELGEWINGRELWEVEIDGAQSTQVATVDIKHQHFWTDFWAMYNGNIYALSPRFRYWVSPGQDNNIWVERVKLIRRIGTPEEYYGERSILE